jgi:hypothetical protein
VVLTRQAPLRPESRKAFDRKPSSGRGTIASSKDGLFEDDFRTTKKDKRIIKHSTFMSKVAKSYKKTPKRRRPSKKLVANLDSLADALPEAEGDDQSQMGNQGHIIKHKTLKHRPGAMKRKEKLEHLERNRFMKNMAQMTAIETNAAKPADSGSGTNPESNSTSNRWAALRGFISQTMEHQAAFKNSE